MLLGLVMMPFCAKAQVSVWDGTYAPWTKGSGTATDPFLIENARQLAYLAYRVNNGLDTNGGYVSNHNLHYKLMVDVDLNGSDTFQWSPIGYWVSNTNYQRFGGHFDGNNHTVSGLHINSTVDRVGFFGYTDGAVVENLTVTGDTVSTTGYYAGALIGYAKNNITVKKCHSIKILIFSNYCSGGIIGRISYGSGSTVTITNCYNTGSVTSSSCSTSYSYSGGIIGYIYGSATVNITNCYNTGNVSSLVSSLSKSPHSGGIIGFNSSSTVTIINCYNTGSVSSSSSSSYSYSGGIIGYNCSFTTGTITHSYNTGSVSSSSRSTYYSYSGGIIGCNGSETVTITNCYNTGSVSSSSSSCSYSGGIIGLSSNRTVFITNCYNTGNVSSCCSNSGGINGGVRGIVTNCYYLSTCGGNNTYGGSPMTAEVMKTAEFVDTLNNGSFAWMRDVTPYKNDGYPLLSGIIGSTTLSVDSVTQTHAKLKGIIQVENDSILSVGFRYKIKEDTVWTYQQCNAIKDTIFLTLSGLLPATEYNCQIYIHLFRYDTVYGHALSFTTQSVSVTTNPATDLTSSSATLNGYMSVGDAVVAEKGFRFRKVGNTTFTTVKSSGTSVNFSYALYGLAVNATYEYQAYVTISLVTGNEAYYGNLQRFEISLLNEDTINIRDAAMLRWVADKCNSGNTFAGKYIRLMNNIVLPQNVPNNMTSIGIYPNYPFCGTFDGNGLLITNLYIDQPNTPYQGFFGYTKDAKLYEVGLVNITASGRNYTGGMVAYASNTTMRDCYVNGGTLYALRYCGGLVGYQDTGTSSIISGCYNTCVVSGSNYVGGLVGYSNHATVRNSYVAAGVTAQGTAVGAIIGGADEVLMYNCWFNTNTTGQSNAIGENHFKSGSEGMSDEEMRDPAFVATLNQGLSKPVWKSDYTKAINKGFPILKWQYSDAESCGAPENLSSSVNAGTITFRWSGGENAKSFIVEYGRVGDTAQQMQTTARQLQVNYQQGETYFWRVKSICSFGESGFVNGSNVSTGIAEAKAVPSLKLYPNPTDGKVTVSGVTCDRLQVSDIYGKVLGTFESNGETTVLDFSRYAAGVYVIRAWDGARMAGIGKVVKR